MRLETSQKTSMLRVTNVVEPFWGRGPLLVTNLRFAMCTTAMGKNRQM